MDKNKDYKKEGVYYTPSSSVRDYIENPDDFLEQFENSEKQKNNQSKKPDKINNKKINKNKKTNKNKKSRYPVFMAVTICSGLVVFALVLIMVKNLISPPETALYAKTEETTLNFHQDVLEKENEDLIVDNTDNNMIGMIRSKSENGNEITLYDISDNSVYVASITRSSDLRNSYGESITYEELSDGDIVEFKFDRDKNIINLSKSRNSFEEGPISNFTINTKEMKIKKGTKEYTYTDATKFLYNNSEFEPEKIDGTIDTITLKGYKDVVWTVIMESGHSEIKINKNDKIKNGIIEIDTDIYKKLSDSDIFKVKEGNHKIVVKGDNIESFSREINLAINESYTLDLSEIKIKEGTLFIKTNVNDYALYINDTLELSREPLVLPYGEYFIKILKDGYVSYENHIKINSESYTVNAQLAKEIKLGTLVVTSIPSSAELLIDGSSVGTTPYSTDLPQGEHSITVRKNGYKDTTISSIYISEKEAQYNITLQPKTSETIPEPSQETQGIPTIQ